MSGCRHIWRMVDVQARPLACRVVCEGCHAIVGARAYERGGDFCLDLRVHFYGHRGLALADMRELHDWLLSLAGPEVQRPNRAARRRRRRLPARAA